jgi:hypothetical protein
MELVILLVLIGFEALTAVVMKSTTTFWDITPCNPLKDNQCSSETSVDLTDYTALYLG